MDKQELRDKIHEEIRKAEQDIEELEGLTRPISPENAIGRISRMDAINNKSVNDAALRKAKQRLTGLNNALGKIDLPDFGKCLKCHQPIPLGRLMLMPHTTRCVNCA